VSREDHARLVVARKERLKEILLRPGTPLVDYHMPWILVGQKYVMEVKKDASRQTRQDVQDDPIDVTARLDGVRRIHKQDIARLEIREMPQRDILRAKRDDISRAGERIEGPVLEGAL
jgi:hypothetical protein